jgi:hypothetical protein
MKEFQIIENIIEKILTKISIKGTTI